MRERSRNGIDEIIGLGGFAISSSNATSENISGRDEGGTSRLAEQKEENRGGDAALLLNAILAINFSVLAAPPVRRVKHFTAPWFRSPMKISGVRCRRMRSRRF